MARQAPEPGAGPGRGCGGTGSGAAHVVHGEDRGGGGPIGRELVGRRDRGDPERIDRGAARQALPSQGMGAAVGLEDPASSW